MITKFKIFESSQELSDELRDILQDLELDYIKKIMSNELDDN